MGMVNGLAAAEPVILLNSETRCSQPILLRDRRFLNRDQKLTHFVRLEIQQISCAQPFRDHQHVTGRDHLFLRQRHEDKHMFILEYLAHADSAFLSWINCAIPFSGSYLPSRPVSVPGDGSSSAGICCATSGAACTNRSALNPKKMPTVLAMLNFRFMPEYVPAITTIKDSKQAIAATSQQFIRQIGAARAVTAFVLATTVGGFRLGSASAFRV